MHGNVFNPASSPLFWLVQMHSTISCVSFVIQKPSPTRVGPAYLACSLPSTSSNQAGASKRCATPSNARSWRRLLAAPPLQPGLIPPMAA